MATQSTVINKVNRMINLIQFEEKNISLYKDMIPNFERRANKRIKHYKKIVFKNMSLIKY